MMRPRPSAQLHILVCSDSRENFFFNTMRQFIKQKNMKLNSATVNPSGHYVDIILLFKVENSKIKLCALFIF